LAAASASGPHDEPSGLLQELHDDDDGERAANFSVGELAVHIVGAGARSEELAGDMADVMEEDARLEAEEIEFEEAIAMHERGEIERPRMMQGMGETLDTPRSAAQGHPFFVPQVCDRERETLAQPPARLSPAQRLPPGCNNWEEGNNRRAPDNHAGDSAGVSDPTGRTVVQAHPTESGE
jgi:hypothetical protein